MKKSFKQVMEWYLKNLNSRMGLATQTQKSVAGIGRNILIPEFGDKYLSHGEVRGKKRLVKGDVMAFRSKLLRDGKADATVIKYIVTGITAINRAKEYEDWDLPNPFSNCQKGLQPGAGEREITSEEETKFMFSFEYKDVLLIMLDTGARGGEIRGLKWNQVVMGEDAPYIKLRFKSNKDRKIFLSERAFRIIKSQSVESPYVFPHLLGKSGYDRFIKSFHIARKAAGIAYCRPHDFRRTSGYRKRRAGASLDSLQVMFGHASFSTTERVYARVDESKALEAVLTCGKAL